MKGDIVVVQAHHEKVARKIIPQIIERITKTHGIYTIAIGGESGSGKSEISLAIHNVLEKQGIKSVILGQDDYFYLPPKANSDKRHSDPDWLGPHNEVNLDLLGTNLRDARQGKPKIQKPLVDYDANTIETVSVDLRGIKVLIAEGTYTLLLRNIDTRIFINRNWIQTYEDRKNRNRGIEVHDPYTENILATEHKIIAGHKYLADFIVDHNYKVIRVDFDT